MSSVTAAIVRAAKTDPDRLLAGTRWPLALDDPRVQQPYGFEPAPLLSGLKGVVGFTNEDAHVSVLEEYCAHCGERVQRLGRERRAASSSLRRRV